MLPLSAKRHPDHPLAHDAIARPQASTQCDAPKPSILVVDDISANRMVLEMFLTRHGFDVTLADGGAAAVTLAAQHRFDAILMDVHMPVIDGYEAARRIRAAELPGRRALMFAVTAAIGSDVRGKCLAAGMDDHFAKPLNLVNFCRTLTHLVAARGS